MQRGQVIERSGRFYVRFYDSGGKMVAKWICDKDAKHHSKTCKPVRLRQQELMLAVNSERDVEDKGATVALADFWSGTFSPYIQSNRRASTADSYEDLWRRHISPALGKKPLAEIKTVDCSRLLTSLAEKGLGRNTIAHVRSTLSAVLTHACNLGIVDRNPVRGCKVLAKMKDPGQTPFYTEEEVKKIIEALEGMPDCQAAVALGFYCGLRTSEIRGLRWSNVNFENGTVTVSQSYVRGVLGRLKTPESHADLPLVRQVAAVLLKWSEERPEGEFVFSNGRGSPADLREMARKRIRPRLAEKKIEWKGYYAGRRGLATLIARLKGPLAASQALRHRNMSVTMSAYIRQDKRELAEAMKLLEGNSAKED